MGEADLLLGDTNHLKVKASYTVEMYDKLHVTRPGKPPVSLDITIVADFESVPKEYHNTFIQMLSARYGGTINCYENVEPFAIITNKKRKWWQIWKQNN